MRLLHVTTNFEKLAGAEQALINLIESGLGQESMIVALRSDALARKVPLPETCQVQALGLPRVSIFRAWRELRAIAEEFQPDIVIGWMYHGNVAARLLSSGIFCSRPVVWTIHHALDDLRSESVSTKLAIAASALMSRSVNAIVYVSSRALDQHQRLFGNATRSFVIPNVTRIERSKMLKVRAPGKTVGFAARYHPTKDFQTFLRTVRLVHSQDPSVRFIACGEGTSPDNKALAESERNEGVLAGEIEWRGPLRDMAEFYNEIDLLLLTSRAEGFGMVLAEAMSHGVPCVATDVGAAREIMGEIGHIVPVGDVEALARGILDELDKGDAERRAQSGLAMDHFARGFHPVSVHEQFEALLTRLISEA